MDTVMHMMYVAPALEGSLSGLLQKQNVRSKQRPERWRTIQMGGGKGCFPDRWNSVCESPGSRENKGFWKVEFQHRGGARGG